MKNYVRPRSVPYEKLCASPFRSLSKSLVAAWPLASVRLPVQCVSCCLFVSDFVFESAVRVFVSASRARALKEFRADPAITKVSTMATP
jgi:hypothetical protein